MTSTSSNQVLTLIETMISTQQKFFTLTLAMSSMLSSLMHPAIFLLSYTLTNIICTLCAFLLLSKVRRVMISCKGCQYMQALTDAVATYGPGVASLAGTPISTCLPVLPRSCFLAVAFTCALDCMFAVAYCLSRVDKPGHN